MTGQNASYLLTVYLFISFRVQEWDGLRVTLISSLLKSRDGIKSLDRKARSHVRRLLPKDHQDPQF